MKCFLHIGTEKTATTTIQNFFDINRDILLEQGFIYTKTAGRTNNRALSVAAYNPSRRDDFTKDKGINSDSDLLIFQQNTIQDLEKELMEISNKDATVIFSSEHFQSRLTNLEEIERLRNILQNLGFTDISLIVYLRRPSDIANSLYSTAIRSGACLEAPPSPKHPYWNNVCNHKNTIEKFSLVFGSNAIIPRLFDKKELINGSVIEDILNVIGIPNNQSYNIPNNANEGLSIMGVRLLIHLNKVIPLYIDNSPNPLRNNLGSYVQKHFSSGIKYIMPNNLYYEYEEEFNESNNWVKKKYFPHKESLFPTKIPDKVSAILPSDAEVEILAQFIADIWNDKQKRILTLTNRST
jgi:hypothetical protein